MEYYTHHLPVGQRQLKNKITDKSEKGEKINFGQKITRITKVFD